MFGAERRTRQDGDSASRSVDVRWQAGTTTGDGEATMIGSILGAVFQLIGDILGFVGAILGAIF